MKTITFFIAFLLACLWLRAQKPTATQLLSFTAGSTNYVSHTVQNKNPQKAAFENSGVQQPYPKDSIDNRYLLKKLQSQKAYLQVQKLSAQEYEYFKQMVLAEGFLQSKAPGKVRTELFQKKEITIAATQADAEEQQWYYVSIEKKALPRIKDLQFAEDLLAFDSHQHLILVFGQQNVSKDKFYTATGSVINCSVIYPASSREVVFLWQDTTNLRRLDCIRVGGNMHTAGAMRYNNVLAQNQWISRQGLYATMTLNQLQTRNGNILNFYGWGGGARGNLCGSNSGNVDFNTLDLAFGCLNCNDDAYYGKQQLASDRVIEDGRRVFIATMIFYPPAAINE